MNVTWLYPAPDSIVPVTHPAQGRDMRNTDVSRTISEHDLSLLDDYDRVQRDDWLDIGGFK